jgi:hypothetical protein
VPVGAKRFGLGGAKGDLELELRLRRIEAALEARASAYDFGDSSDFVQRLNTVPRVSGLRLLGIRLGFLILDGMSYGLLRT